VQKRTVSAILVWMAIALLLLNGYLKSPWIIVVCIGVVISAVMVYFIPRPKK